MTRTPYSKRELFEQLAGATSRATTVVTPNLRLAQELAREFDRYQIGRGLTLWEAPDILPWSGFVSRAYDDAMYSAGGAGLPVLLAPAEEQALWEDCLRGADDHPGLLAVPQAAAAARDAWKTAHAWRLLEPLRRFPRNEDAEAFLRWAQRYERSTRQAGQTDAARLPDVVAGLLDDPGVKKPALLACYGFDMVTAQQQAVLDELAARGSAVRWCSPERRESVAMRLRCLDARDEIRQAARWARQRLEAALRDGKPVRIGIVVPDLAAQRNALRRIFGQTLEAAQGPPFNISLGEPLDAYPLVDAAFAVLELAGRSLPFERASQIVRSPFIAAGESERVARARLDAALRKRAEPELSLDRLSALLGSHPSQPATPVLSAKLKALSEFRKARLFGRQSPAAWARAFSEALSLAGFPGERTPSSAEFQTLAKWHEVVAEFARLERVTPRLGYGEALARLRRMAADAAFQPESPEVPVQILGVLESAGCGFDHLWVMGLTAEAWPLAARPTPFLPVALQREAGQPEASAQASLELDRRITEGWLGAAREVVFSHPSREADRELSPSPLIAGIAEGALELPAFKPYRNLIYESSVMERLPDGRGPPVMPGERRGGSAVLRDQAACPFRAFARHRLRSEALEAPHAGLDALERGSLVHQVLAAAWTQLKDKGGLDRAAEADLAGLLEAAADAAVARLRRERPATLDGRFALIEKRRLARLARDWLELERARGDFRVEAVEAERTLGVAGLQLKGRLDRVDETADGKRIVIDYKVRAPGAAAWVGERPDDPQLPLYLTAAEPAAQAIAFAQVRAGDMKFVALAADESLLPGARSLPDARLKRAAETWGDQLEAWRVELERLALGFAAGEATADPKPGACEYCDQHTFCRIAERDAGLGESGEEP